MRFLLNKWVLVFLILLGVFALGLTFKEKISNWLGGYELTSNGYKYKFTQGKKLSKNLGPGYHIIYQYLLIGPNGDTLENKAYPGVEQERPYPVESKNETEEIMQMATPGSVFEILVSTDTLKLRTGNNMKIMGLPDHETAKWVIHVIKLLKDNEFEAYKNEKFMERLSKENRRIDNYTDRVKENWILDSFKFIKYFIKPKLDVPRFKVGDEVEFNTEVYTLDGTLLTSSGMEGRKYKLKVGSFTYEIEAFDTIMHYLGDGEGGDFLVTSDYAFGDEGKMPFVPPYTPLLIKIRDLKKLNK